MYYIMREPVVSARCIWFLKVHCARLKNDACANACIIIFVHYIWRLIKTVSKQTTCTGNAHQLSCLRAGARMLIVSLSSMDSQHTIEHIECVLLQEAIVDLLGGLMTTICRCSRCAFLPVHCSVVSLAAHRTVSCKAASAAFWHSQPLCLKQS